MFNPYPDPLFRDVYNCIKTYDSKPVRHNYYNLQSLTKWYEYLDTAHYRYTMFMVTLTYNDTNAHKPTHMKTFLDTLKYHFKVSGESVPLHHVWSLEYRDPLITNTDKATGYHYHVFFAYNRDITTDVNQLHNLITKYWSYGNVNFSNNRKPHYLPSKVYKDFNNRYLPSPVLNTETDNVMSVFHHLTYLTKSDINQQLPDDYEGKAFKCSTTRPALLTSHSRIKYRNNTLRLKHNESIDYLLPDDNWLIEGEPPF